ncbi:MAG: 2-haloacid dehalogenase [Gammaproteobacteria bacterium]|jgi:2-haloacid dehalogenase
MGFEHVKALTFDTGGTILDWHTGFRTALEQVGYAHGIERDWATIANELRRRSLQKMINLGEHEAPEYNFDGAHRRTLDELINEHDLGVLTEAERHFIAYERPHTFECWPDFPAALPRLRDKRIVASFTILSFRIIIDTARNNGLSWDAVISCEAIGKYKILPAAYETAARYLQLDPGEICMVACHNFDLDAAKAVGFNTAFVRRPDEWGAAGSPDPNPNAANDIIVDTFPELVDALA